MTNQQLYFAIGVPVFTVIFGMAMNVLFIVWQNNQLRQSLDIRFKSVDDGLQIRFKSIDERLDRIAHTLELIQTDLKEFYRDIVRIKQKIGLD